MEMSEVFDRFSEGFDGSCFANHPPGCSAVLCESFDGSCFASRPPGAGQCWVVR